MGGVFDYLFCEVFIDIVSVFFWCILRRLMFVLYLFPRCGVGCVLMMGIGVVCMRWICIRLFIGIILCICLAVEGAGVMKGRRMEGISSSDH